MQKHDWLVDMAKTLGTGGLAAYALFSAQIIVALLTAVYLTYQIRLAHIKLTRGNNGFDS